MSDSVGERERRLGVIARLASVVGSGDLFESLRGLDTDEKRDRAADLLDEHLDSRTYCKVAALLRIAGDEEDELGFRGGPDE